MANIKSCYFLLLLIFTSVSPTFAKDKVHLPDYKSWEVTKYDPSSPIYFTYKKCETQEDMNVGRNRIALAFDEYREPNSDRRLHVIMDVKGEEHFIMYMENDADLYLFEREKRFFIFGHGWRHIDTLSDESVSYEELVEQVRSFYLRHCIFFQYF